MRLLQQIRRSIFVARFFLLSIVICAARIEIIFLNKQDAYHSKIQAAAFAWGIWPTLTACLLSFRQLRRNWYETTSEHILKLLCDIYWIRCLRSPHATTSWNFLSTSHLIVAPHTAMTLTHSPLYITSTATASSVRPSACNGNGRPGLPCRENWIHGHGVSSIGYRSREGLVVFFEIDYRTAGRRGSPRTRALNEARISKNCDFWIVRRNIQETAGYITSVQFLLELVCCCCA